MRSSPSGSGPHRRDAASATASLNTARFSSAIGTQRQTTGTALRSAPPHRGACRIPSPARPAWHPLFSRRSCSWSWRVAELGRSQFVAQCGGELGAHLLEAAARAGADAIEPDDVVTELRLDRLAELALLHGEQLVGKLLLVDLAARPAQVAALGCGGGVLRVLLGQLGEIRTALDLLVEILCLRQRLGIVGRGVRR